MNMSKVIIGLVASAFINSAFADGLILEEVATKKINDKRSSTEQEIQNSQGEDAIKSVVEQSTVEMGAGH